MSSKRGRKRNDNLPPNRARDVQRAFRARRAAHLLVRIALAYPSCGSIVPSLRSLLSPLPPLIPLSSDVYPRAELLISTTPHPFLYYPDLSSHFNIPLIYKLYNLN